MKDKLIEYTKIILIGTVLGVGVNIVLISALNIGKNPDQAVKLNLTNYLICISGGVFGALVGKNVHDMGKRNEDISSLPESNNLDD